MCESLAKNRMSVAVYHAGLTDTKRVKVQRDWQAGRVQVVGFGLL